MSKNSKDKRQAPAPSDGAEEESEHVRTLSVPELVEKLNSVPVFKVVDDETGDIVPTPDKGGSACMCWYADHHDVQVALAVVQHLHPERRMSIGVTPLGTALAMSEGWGTGLPDAPLRLQASTTVLRATKEELEPLPDSLRQALNARTSAFPLFLMEELQSASASPVFLRREDLVACWQASGRPAAAMPSSLIMYDLRVLCVKMMSTPADWRSLVFVAPQPSMQAVDGTRQHPAVAELEREAAASRGDEPPPLEASVPG